MTKVLTINEMIDVLKLVAPDHANLRQHISDLEAVARRVARDLSRTTGVSVGSITTDHAIAGGTAATVYLSEGRSLSADVLEAFSYFDEGEEIEPIEDGDAARMEFHHR